MPASPTVTVCPADDTRRALVPRMPPARDDALNALTRQHVQAFLKLSSAYRECADLMEGTDRELASRFRELQVRFWGAAGRAAAPSRQGRLGPIDGRVVRLLPRQGSTGARS